MENLRDIKVSDIVQKYLNETGLSLRDFASSLMEGLYPGDDEITISHASIQYWKIGKTEPKTDFLLMLLITNRNWKFDFAMQCLIAKRPEVWGPDGIWKLAADLLLPVAG